jgi:hypothetical protein
MEEAQRARKIEPTTSEAATASSDKQMQYLRI